jgi:hypothetical protein
VLAAIAPWCGEDAGDAVGIKQDLPNLDGAGDQVISQTRAALVAGAGSPGSRPRARHRIRRFHATQARPDPCAAKSASGRKLAEFNSGNS